MRSKHLLSLRYHSLTHHPEFVTEAPLTAEQTTALADLYNPSKGFYERIETCIQKYRAKRKWNDLRIKVFNAYLSLGGIKQGPKMFQGLDTKRVSDLDAEEIAMQTATDYVRLDEEDEWEVDFCNIVKAFLSYKVPYVMCIQKNEELEQSCQIIKNFLNYVCPPFPSFVIMLIYADNEQVLLHNVAPEYTDNILKARSICDQAERELILCKEMSHRFPGGFNMACSTIFDGYYAGMNAGVNPPWLEKSDIEVGMPITTAWSSFFMGLQQHGTTAQQKSAETTKVIKRSYMLLEVVDVVIPESIPSEEEGQIFTGLKTLGKLKVQSFAPEVNGEQPDVPEEDTVELELWIEKEHLQYCFKGMKVEGRVHELDNGVRFIDGITVCHPGLTIAVTFDKANGKIGSHVQLLHDYRRGE